MRTEHVVIGLVLLLIVLALVLVLLSGSVPFLADFLRSVTGGK